MKQIKAFFGSLMHDEEGASAIEYTLLLVMVALVVVGFITPIGNKLKTIFNDIVNAL